uniref:MADF domain-containing protein n=1 Tax=Anopheles atroparvus TaxID=41427 RepID=A0AAG5DS90_ANOAO
MQKIRYFTMAEEEAPFAVEGLETVDISSKRHYVKVNESLFVNEIKKRPILYNILHKDYKRITLRNEAWVAVATAMGLSVQECKKRWRSMRDAFLKTVRNKGEEERKSWIHYRLLEFLLPFIRSGYVKGDQKASSDFYECNENSSDFDYVELDDDLDMYGDGPITVSYVTEDGKELFQILHRPGEAELQESEPADVEDAQEELDDIETEGQLTSLLRPHGATVDEVQHLSQEQACESQEVDYLLSSDPEEASEPESLLDEERLDSTMLEFRKRPNETERNEPETEAAEAHEECYESAEEMLEPEQQQPISNSVRKRRKMEPEAHRSIKEENCDVYGAYQVLEPTLVPPTAAPQPPPPRTPPVPSPPQREEECRNQGSKEMDARLGITDPDERFLMSCAPILRRLPNKKNLLARLRIQQMLYELEYDEKYEGT